MKKYIIIGAGAIGRKAFNYLGWSQVHSFVDNFKSGFTFCDKPVISFDELVMTHRDFEVITALSEENCSEVVTQLNYAGILYKNFNSFLRIEELCSDVEIAKLEGSHKGEKVVLVANGPSLHTKDLDVLRKNNIYTFGCNRIYKIFGAVDWRPDVYFINDVELFNIDYKTILNLTSDKFIKNFNMPYADTASRQLITNLWGYTGNLYCFNELNTFTQVTIEKNTIKTSPKLFSDDFSKGSYLGYTVMYCMLQCAAYMGFSEIFLIGCDNTSTVYGSNGFTEHFSKDYHNERDLVYLQNYNKNNILDYNYHFIQDSYSTAEQYSRKHGFRIYNATRGGRLEAFERVDFDEIFR